MIKMTGHDLILVMNFLFWTCSQCANVVIAGYNDEQRPYLERHAISAVREDHGDSSEDKIKNKDLEEENTDFTRKTRERIRFENAFGDKENIRFYDISKNNMNIYSVLSHSSLIKGLGSIESRNRYQNDYTKNKRDADYQVEDIRPDKLTNNVLSTWYNDSSIDADVHKGYNDDNNEVMYPIYCPEMCRCDIETNKVDCSQQNLTSVPKGISPYTTWLDLSMNNIQRLPEDAFVNLLHLKELVCAGNNLTELPHRLFRHNKYLTLLNFQGNFFKKVPPRAFQNLSYLLELHLDANQIVNIPRNAFVGLYNLKQLWLDDNKLSQIPVLPLRELTNLQALTLIKNEISHLPDYAFQNNTKLIQLRLANNTIKEVADQAFYGLTRLKYLQLQKNKISKMPSSFSHLVSLEELNLENNGLTEIPKNSFQMKQRLSTLTLGNNHIVFVAKSAFINMPSLQELKLSEVHDMVTFPELTGTTNLTLLQLDRANIRFIPSDICSQQKKLKTFDVHSNKIGTIPQMSQCQHLAILNVGKNELTSVDGQLFNGLYRLKDLTLSINFIHSIPEDAFIGLDGLEYLNLAENQIREIHPNAFLPLKSLKDLNLDDNRIHTLPTAGLISLERLKVVHNPDLREFPPKEEFPNVNNFALSYPYHCCDFILSGPEETTDNIEESIEFHGSGIPESMLSGHANFTSNLLSILKNFTIDNDLWESFGHSEDDMPSNHQSPVASSFGEDYQSSAYDQNYFSAKAAILCTPLPGPFMPCDDLFGWWSLRCGIWFVFMLALLGNGVVFFVSVTSKSKMDVPRFLICNLALADFFMGIYLGILAIVDASTLGHFKKYAIPWQMSAGCLIAGTLGVLSSELSVFTLTVITLERFYAITHAMQLNKRLSLRNAGFIMMCGWLWSFGLAILPLFGISDYRKFAVCLPFEIENLISKSYVCFIMVFNAISFFIILSCYLIMYISIRHSQAWNSNDTRVAKRMALLVFTDFLCWAPIAFLSLSAAFGKNLIHLNEAKVLTIFVLPLNSCANPFLYAFFTKQFKKDCVLLCRRFEDSFLAKHFSQVSQRHASLSWKYQRRPSGLNSLMGESRGNNSQNNSSGSNSYGVVNYNSEVNSETNRGLAAGSLKCDKYLVQTTVHNNGNISHGNGCRIFHKHVHKYQPCPSDDNVLGDSVVKNFYAEVNDDADENDVQVILQDHYSLYGPENMGLAGESYASDDDNVCQFNPLSQKYYTSFSKDDTNSYTNGGLQCPSIVIYEDNSTPTDKSQSHHWICRSQHSIYSKQPEKYQQGECYGGGIDECEHMTHPEKQKDTFLCTRMNNLQTHKQSIKHLSVNEDILVSSTAACSEEIKNKVIEKLSASDSNLITSDDPGREKFEALSMKQKIGELVDKEVPVNDIHEVMSCQDVQGSRRATHCCTISSSPGEQRDFRSSDCTCTVKSEPFFQCTSAVNCEQMCKASCDNKNDQTQTRTREKNLNRIISLASSGNHLEAPPTNIAFAMKRKMMKRTNSLVQQQKVRKMPTSLHPTLYSQQSVQFTSPTQTFSEVMRTEQIGKPTNSNMYHNCLYPNYMNNFQKKLSSHDDYCTYFNKHAISNRAPNNLVQMTSTSSPPAPAVTPRFVHIHREAGRHSYTQYLRRSVTRCEILCKSNSLVELGRAQAEESETLPLTSEKRRSLTPTQEGHM